MIPQKSFFMTLERPFSIFAAKTAQEPVLLISAERMRFLINFTKYKLLSSLWFFESIAFSRALELLNSEQADGNRCHSADAHTQKVKDRSRHSGNLDSLPFNAGRPFPGADGSMESGAGRSASNGGFEKSKSSHSSVK